MENIKEIIEKKEFNNVNENVNRKNINTNVNDIYYKRKDYSINKTQFKPYTEETSLAYEIADYLDDFYNFACYLYYINEFGCEVIRQLFAEAKDIMRKKSQTKDHVRNKGSYFSGIVRNYRNRTTEDVR